MSRESFLFVTSLSKFLARWFLFCDTFLCFQNSIFLASWFLFSNHCFEFTFIVFLFVAALPLPTYQSRSTLPLLSKSIPLIQKNAKLLHRKPALRYLNFNVVQISCLGVDSHSRLLPTVSQLTSLPRHPQPLPQSKGKPPSHPPPDCIPRFPCARAPAPQ